MEDWKKSCGEDESSDGGEGDDTEELRPLDGHKLYSSSFLQMMKIKENQRGMDGYLSVDLCRQTQKGEGREEACCKYIYNLQW